mgnify:CR=1 FL=1
MGTHMSDTTAIRYTYLEEYDVHEYLFKESSRRAMDEYVQLIHEIYEEHIAGRSDILIILDIHESGMLPVKYAGAVMQKLFEDFAPFPKVYITYLSDDASDKSLIGIMDYTIPIDVDRVQFPVQARDQAIERLLKKRNIIV